tara:strand:+ start:13 stop:228 length:216 start_codon:yes stop_codon:yes gene_type:complete
MKIITIVGARPQTEWVEIVETKSAIITDTNSDLIIKSTAKFLNNDNLVFPPVFGDGNASTFIVNEIINQFS